MTYLELIYLILLVILPISLAIVTESPEGFFGGIGIVIVIGCFISLGSSVSNDFKITSKFETTPVLVKLDNEKLNVVTDEYKTYIYTDYATIQKYKNGCNFYKVYSYKQCFWLDEEKMELIIE